MTIGKILVVDDDRVARTLVASSLQSFDVEIIFASDGQRALHIIEDNSDIVLCVLDYQMPVMNGIEFLEWIQSGKLQYGGEIIMQSGIIALHNIEEVLRKKVEYFIPKPIDRAGLQQYVAKVLSRILDAKEEGRWMQS